MLKNTTKSSMCGPGQQTPQIPISSSVSGPSWNRSNPRMALTCNLQDPKDPPTPQDTPRSPVYMPGQSQAQSSVVPALIGTCPRLSSRYSDWDVGGHFDTMSLGGWAVLKHHQRGCHKPSFPSRTLDWFKKIIAIHNSVVSMLCADCSMSYVHLVFDLCKLFWSLLERSTFFLHKCQFMCGKMLKHCFWVYTVFIHLAQGPKFPIIQHKNHTFIPYSL